MYYELEICTSSTEGAIAAYQGGAERIELCSALALGGLTPSIGCIECVRRAVPLTQLFVLIRPREGDFVYSAQEIAEMCCDIERARAAGADGFVFGVLTTEGRYDEEKNRMLLAAAAGLPCTFHRAFDVAANQQQLLETLVKEGFQRILTSGRAATALEGADCLAELVRLADGRIGIQCAGGIDATNIDLLRQKTQAPMYHGSFREKLSSSHRTHQSKINMGSLPESPLLVTSVAQVRAARNILNRA